MSIGAITKDGKASSFDSSGMLLEMMVDAREEDVLEVVVELFGKVLLNHGELFDKFGRTGVLEVAIIFGMETIDDIVAFLDGKTGKLADFTIFKILFVQGKRDLHVLGKGLNELFTTS